MTDLAIDYKALEADGYSRCDIDHRGVLFVSPAPETQAWTHAGAGTFGLGGIYLHDNWYHISGLIDALPEDVSYMDRSPTVETQMMEAGWIRRMRGTLQDMLGIKFDSRVVDPARVERLIQMTAKEPDFDGMIIVEDIAEDWDRGIERDSKWEDISEWKDQPDDD